MSQAYWKACLCLYVGETYYERTTFRLQVPTYVTALYNLATFAFIFTYALRSYSINSYI